MELVLPSVAYRDSYLAALGEMANEKQLIQIDADQARTDFDSFVQGLLVRAEGKNLPKGYVSETIFWLVDEGEYIGRVSIRHSLTPHLLDIGGHIGYDIRPSARCKGYGKKILELALPQAKELGIDRVLLTCDETNAGSRKIIEANDGILEDKRPNPEGGPDKLRYWIQL